MSLFTRLLGQTQLPGQTQPTSKEIAKDRLQLVLFHDRVKLNPGDMEQLKSELVQVISKYLIVDSDGVQLAVSHVNRQSRLTAEAPVTALFNH